MPPAPTPHAVIIRAATPDDTPALALLRYRFRAGREMANEPEADFVRRAGAWMHTRLAQTNWRAWVACDGGAGGEIIGHLWAQVIEKIPNPVPEPEQIIYLTNAYVLPEWRNAGIGGRLMAAALAEFNTPDVYSVILWASGESERLYRRHGFNTPRRILERPAPSL